MLVKDDPEVTVLCNKGPEKYNFLIESDKKHFKLDFQQYQTLNCINQPQSLIAFCIIKEMTKTSCHYFLYIKKNNNGKCACTKVAIFRKIFLGDISKFKSCDFRGSFKGNIIRSHN